MVKEILAFARSGLWMSGLKHLDFGALKIFLTDEIFASQNAKC